MTGGLAAVFLFVWLLPTPPALRGIANYLPMHMTMESFAIIVAMLVFGVTWNAYSSERAGNVIMLACAMLAVGLLDFAHMLSFKGMPDFVTPSGTEKAISFWLAARFIAALALLVAAVRPWTPLCRGFWKYALLLGALAVTALVFWVVLFHPAVLPRTFVEGDGLTPFKVAAEYLIVGLLVVAVVLFYRQARRGVAYDAAGLFTAAAISILSELSFTLYKNTTDIFNLLGHVYKVVAYLFIYRAMFVTTVREPFQRLAAAEARYRAIFTGARDGIVLIDAETGLIAACNPEFERQCGRPLAELRTLHIWELRPAELRAAARRKFEEIRDAGEGGGSGLDFERPDGSRVSTEFLSRRVRNGERDYIQSINRDIGERKRMEQALHDSEERFRVLATSAPDGIILIDGAGTVVFWNTAAERLFGYTAEEALGRELHLLIVPPQHRNAAAAGMQQFLGSGAGPMIGASAELETLRKDGTTFIAEHSISAMRLNGAWHAMGVVRDTTQRRELQRSLERQLDELRRFQDVALGRELRMKALVEENERLEARLSELARQPKH
jgi:PAS domain S-box-containing protein